MALTEDQKRRCLIAAQYLEDVVSLLPAEQFDMQDWKCGTAACAVGHLAQCDQLTADGLELLPDPFSGNREVPYFCGRVSWGAVVKFFGVEEPFEAGHYFHRNLRDNERGVTPMDVADELRRIAGES